MPSYSLFPAAVPIQPGTVVVLVNPPLRPANDLTYDARLTDDRLGALTGTGGSGTIDYETGALTVSLDAGTVDRVKVEGQTVRRLPWVFDSIDGPGDYVREAP